MVLDRRRETQSTPASHTRVTMLVVALAVSLGLPIFATAEEEQASLCVQRDRFSPDRARPGSRLRYRSECPSREVKVSSALALCVGQRHGANARTGSVARVRKECREDRELQVADLVIQSNPELLFVQSASSSVFSQGRLSLIDQFDTSYFSERPNRLHGTLATATFVGAWSGGPDSFESDPPNAEFVCTSEDGQQTNATVVLRNPITEDDGVSYEVQILSGSLPSSCESASLFIDGNPIYALISGCASDAVGTLLGWLTDKTSSARSFPLRGDFTQVMQTLEQEYDVLKLIVSGLIQEVQELEQSTVVAAPPQPAAYPPGVETHPAIGDAEFPAACLDDNDDTNCSPDHHAELAMERKFWAITVNADHNKMKEWVSSATKYAENSYTSYDARIRKFASFGNVMISLSYKPCDPQGYSYLVQAVKDVVASLQSNPHNPNALANALYLVAVSEFIIDGVLGFSVSEGKSTLKEMVELALHYGPPSTLYNEGLGSELRFVGLMGHTQLLSSVPNGIQYGIDGFDDGNDWSAVRTTSLAPFKEVGAQVILAEAHAALNQPDKVQERFDAIATWLAGNNAPAGYVQEIEATRQELIRSGGLIDQWEDATGLFGSELRQPLGPAERSTVCRVCHTGGTVPDNYYNWRDE